MDDVAVTAALRRLELLRSSHRCVVTALADIMDISGVIGPISQIGPIELLAVVKGYVCKIYIVHFRGLSSFVIRYPALTHGV